MKSGHLEKRLPSWVGEEDLAEGYAGQPLGLGSLAMWEGGRAGSRKCIGGSTGQGVLERKCEEEEVLGEELWGAGRAKGGSAGEEA